MTSVNLLAVKQWHLSTAIPWLVVNKETITHTWIVLGIILLVSLPISYFARKRGGIVHYLITSTTQSFLESCSQTVGGYSFNHFCFLAALFIFIALCNVAFIFPWVYEPTKDINTTLALGTISFMYTQVYAIKAHGIISYIAEFFQPFFLMFPLNVMGHTSSIISLAFRLYGNIFGGWIIGHIYLGLIEGSVIKELVGILSGMNFVIVGFSLFEGLLQAFVFTMLTMTYLSLAINVEDPEVATQAGEVL